jgi:hypothetical protein
MQKILKYKLGIIIAIALLLPVIQFNYGFFEEEPLQGTTISGKPVLNKDVYWSLKWQDEYVKYLNDNFGFRPWLIRCYNQIQFDFFKISKAPGVVIGKQNELFIESYIDDYTGKNFIGFSKINSDVTKLKRLQDSLKVRGKDLIVVFAPGKASFYPELIPDRYLTIKKDSTNYNSFAKAFIQHDVNFIDLNKWFFNNKNKFKHKVYPKYGTHWNHYGMSLAMDTILTYIEKKRNVSLPDFDFSIVNYNTRLKGNDFDVGELTNLLLPLELDANPYPVYKFKTTENNVKPDVLVIGDSYWWCLVGDNLPIHFFKEDEYWFYNKTQLIRNEKREEVKKLNLSASLAKRDVILLIATEATFHMFPYGFTDAAYKLFCNDNSKRISEIINDIKNNRSWMESIVKKADENKVSVEAQLKMDAEYVLSDELAEPKETIEQIVERIKKDETWMKEIRKKANANNVNVEQQIIEDAKWSFENDK